MFPYPSGHGLHCGHFYNYAIVDSYCRYLRHQGIQVYQPFGYDAFGLPAENYARQIGGDPREITYANIERFRAQMRRMNTMYEEKLVTADPSYYKWTQWIFKQLHEKGLAYKALGPVNYCPSCETVLANEQVKEGKCDRCEAQVEIRDLNQWYFRITAYRDRLLQNLERLDYPESTIKQQRRWLTNLRDWCVSRQRSWGCPIPIEGETDTLDTFVDSSFYYLRYLTDSDEEFLPQGCYRPVNLYVGGAEHACMHLIYARFIHYFLFDIGIVPQEEPFDRVIHQGLITKDGAKMAKSKGNVVDPDQFDPDELRLALMFIGPYNEGGEWSDRGIVGIQRFLGRFREFLGRASEGGEIMDLAEFEAKIDRLTRAFKFNRVVSSFMELVKYNKGKTISLATRDRIIALFRNFAPSFSETKHGH